VLFCGKTYFLAAASGCPGCGAFSSAAKRTSRRRGTQFGLRWNDGGPPTAGLLGVWDAIGTGALRVRRALAASAAFKRLRNYLLVWPRKTHHVVGSALNEGVPGGGIAT
jgi:hypothetical protein